MCVTLSSRKGLTPLKWKWSLVYTKHYCRLKCHDIHIQWTCFNKSGLQILQSKCLAVTAIAIRQLSFAAPSFNWRLKASVRGCACMRKRNATMTAMMPVMDIGTTNCNLPQCSICFVCKVSGSWCGCGLGWFLVSFCRLGKQLVQNQTKWHITANRVGKKCWNHTDSTSYQPHSSTSFHGN